TEAVAEGADALAEGRHELDPAEMRDPARHLRGEDEVARGLVGPDVYLLLGGQLVEGRVQLNRRQALGVGAEEVLRPRAGRVERGPPGRVREARGARVEFGHVDIVPRFELIV